MAVPKVAKGSRNILGCTKIGAYHPHWRYAFSVLWLERYLNSLREGLSPTCHSQACNKAWRPWWNMSAPVACRTHSTEDTARGTMRQPHAWCSDHRWSVYTLRIPLAVAPLRRHRGPPPSPHSVCKHSHHQLLTTRYFYAQWANFMKFSTLVYSHVTYQI
jgi:hypothetical protein